MFEHLLRFVLQQRFMMILAAIVLLGAGVFAWKHLPIDAYPDVTNVQVMILAEAPGLAPSEVERLITMPIEIEMGGLPMVTQVRSSSKAGLSQVIVVFEDDADTYFTRQVGFEDDVLDVGHVANQASGDNVHLFPVLNQKPTAGVGVVFLQRFENFLCGDFVFQQ